MKAAGIFEYATELHNPILANLSEASGLIGLRAGDPAQVWPMIQQALTHPWQVRVDVMVIRQELAMPPTIDLAQAAGVSLNMIEAVLSRRGDESVDRARTS